MIAGAIKTGIILATANGIDIPWLISIGEKAFVLFSTLGTVVLLRWLIVYAPFNLFRRHTVAPLVKSVITLLVYFGAAMVLLHRLFGIDLTPLLTTSAVVTGIVALSLQETLKNLFTGLWINTERVVEKGDWIRIADKEGQVMEVTWSTTKLLTRENDYIYLPNRLLAEGALENYTYPMPFHVVEVDIDAGYHEPPNKVKGILIDIARNTSLIMTLPEPDVWVTGFTEFSIRYRLRVWVDDFRSVPLVKSKINTKIWYAFRRNNIEIPFPVRVTYTRAEEKVSDADLIIYSLENMELLSSLSEDEIRRVAAFSKLETFGVGEVIVRQGDVGNACCLIQSGSVDVLLKDSGGEERFIATLRPGEFFGEMSLLTGERRKATVKAKEDTTCIVLTYKAFQGVLIENPNLAGKLSELLVKRSGELEEIKSRAASEREKNDAETAARKRMIDRIRQFFKMG